MMEMYFFGGMTSEGFSTQLTQLINDGDHYTYILKGGPGTGKSKIMKRIAERFSKDEKVTCYRCSSDPDSLDAIVLHTSKVIIVDGTPPHVIEPQLPGVCQEIVPLGMHWNRELLRENREEIIKATELNRSIMTGAANHNRALGIICADTYTCAEGFLHRKKIEEAAGRLCRDLLENRERRPAKGRQIIRQLSAMTRYGYTTLGEAVGSCSRLYILDDGFFAASSMFIDLVAMHIMEHGYDTKLSPCLLSERPISEHLLIDDLDTVVMTSNPLTGPIDEKAEHIDCSIYYDRDRMEPCEKHLEANHILIDTLAGVSRDMFEDAKRVHDQMEDYYIRAMDRDALDSVYEELCGEIERRR